MCIANCAVLYRCVQHVFPIHRSGCHFRIAGMLRSLFALSFLLMLTCLPLLPIQFKYIKGFSYFWKYNVFLFTILAFTLLALIYFVSLLMPSIRSTVLCTYNHFRLVQLLFPSDRKHLNSIVASIKESKSAERAKLSKKLQRSGGTLSPVV